MKRFVFALLGLLAITTALAGGPIKADKTVRSAPVDVGASRPSGEPAPVIRHATYTGELSANLASFEATYMIEVPRVRGEVNIPLFSGVVAVTDVQPDDGLRLVRREDALFAVAVRQGTYGVKLHFRTAVSAHEEIWKQLRFTTGDAAVSEVSVTLEGEDAEVEMLEGATVSISKEGGKTRLTGFAGSDNSVSLRWQARLKESQVQPVVLCNVHQLTDFSPGVIRIRSILEYSIPQGEISRVEAELDASISVVRVSGENVRDWTIDPSGGTQRCRVDLLKAASGRYVLELFGEVPVPDDLPALYAIPEVRAAAVDRQEGALGIVATDMEIAVERTAGLSRVNGASFAENEVWKNSLAVDRLLAAFRYPQPGFNCTLRLDAVKPEIDIREMTTVKIEKERLRLRSGLSANVSRAGLFSMSVGLPADLTITDVTGGLLETWEVTRAGELQQLDMTFKRKALGTVDVAIEAERTYEQLPPSITIKGVSVSGVRRHTGQLKVLAAAGIEAREESSTGVTAAELVASQTREGLGFAFRDPGWDVVLKTQALQPRVAVELLNLVTIGDGFLTGSVMIDYRVEKAGVQELPLRIPKTWRNVDITGLGIRRRTQNGEEWRIALQDQVMGQYALLITYDQPFDAGADTISPFGLQTSNTVSESGYIVVTSGTQLEIREAAAARGLRRVDARELPPHYLGVIENPVLRAYGYASHPYQLELEVVRHEAKPPLGAIVDRAKLVTVVDRSGRRETQVTYLVKNNMKDALRVALPAGGRLWTAFVDNGAVKPQVSEGRVIIPLKKPENRDRAYPVELMYIEEGPKLSRWSRSKLELKAPEIDIRSSFVEWDVYLPQWIKASAFSGSMSPERVSVYTIAREIERVGVRIDTAFARHKGVLFFATFVVLLVGSIVWLLATGRRKGCVPVLVLALVTLVFAAMLLPAISQSRDRAMRISSANNLKQIGLAIKMYAADNGGRTPDTFEDMLRYLGNQERILQDPVTGRRFEYIGAKLNEKDTPVDRPLAYNIGTDGGNVLFMDGHVEWFDQHQIMGYILPHTQFQTVAPAASTEAGAPAGTSVAAGTATTGEGGMAAGLLPIRIEIPKRGRIWTFAKTLATDGGELTIRARLASTTRRRALAGAATIVCLLSGLFLAISGYRRSSCPLHGGAAFLWLAALWILCVHWEFVYEFLLLVPVLAGLAFLAALIRSAPRPKKKPKATPPQPPQPPKPTQPEPPSQATPPSTEAPRTTGGTKVVACLAVLLTGSALFALPCRAAESTPALRAEIIRADYQGSVSGNVARLEGSISIEAVAPLDADGRTVLRYGPAIVHLLGRDAALEGYDFETDGLWAVADGHGFGVRIERPGLYLLGTTFVVPVEGDATGKSLGVRLPRTVAGTVACLIDEKEATVEVPTAVSSETEFKGDKTQVHVHLAADSHLRMSWVPRMKEAREVDVTAFCSCMTIVSVQEGALQQLTRIQYHITQGELTSVRIELPEGLRLLRVTGKELLNWELSEADQGHTLRVDLKTGVQDQTELLLQTERTIVSLPADVQVRVPRPMDIQRSAGVVGILTVGEIGFELHDLEGLQQVDGAEFTGMTASAASLQVPASQTAAPQALPGQLGPLTQAAVEQAFRYRSSAFSLNMRVTRLTPDIEATLNSHVRIRERSVRLECRATYEVRDAGIFELALAIPAEYRVEDVTGKAIRAWAEHGEGEGRYLSVTFGEKIRDTYLLVLVLQKAHDALPERLVIPRVIPRNVDEVKGTVSIATDYGLTLGDYDGDGLSEIPVGHLDATQDGAILAFRYDVEDWNLEIEIQRAEPWVQVEGAHVIHLADGRIRAEATFQYEIENAPVDRLVLAMPPGAENVRITGADMRQCDRTDNRWTVVLQKLTKGAYQLKVSFEVPLAIGSAEALVPLVAAEGIERERGVVLICSTPTLYVKEAARSEQFLLPLDTRDLPAEVREAGGNQARRAYRYLRSNQNLKVQLSRYQAAEVLQANIEKARLVTVLSEDGQLMTQAVFTMRNNAKQNLHVELPEGSDVWSCFVAGEAVQVTLKEGKLLLPLIQTGDEEPSFDVELTYVTPTDPLKLTRRAELLGPVVDLPMHNIRWEMYVPRGYTYSDFGGTVTWRDDIESEYKEFGLSEYTSFLAKKVQGQKQKADELVTKAREMAKMGDAVSARRQYKRAKQIDAGNTFIEQELGQLEKAEAYANAARFSQEGQTYGEILRDNLNEAPPSLPKTLVVTSAEKSAREKVIERMEGIQIPEIDFRQANIRDVIDFLQEASVEFDETGKDDQRGVNIILNLSAGQGEATAPSGPVDPFAAVTGEGDNPADEVPLITFSARYISLFEALRIVTEVANLKFRVTGSVVMVLRKDAPDGEFVHRMYDVLPSVGEKIAMVAPALGSGGDRGGDFISLEGAGAGGGRGEWKEFFENLGVGWPRGSSIKYVPSLGKVILSNTADNLGIFEQVLSMLVGGERSGVAATAWDGGQAWVQENAGVVTDKQVEIAEEQAKKIRKTQAVTVSRVTPLRVNLPVRGFRYLFEQVVWIPGDDDLALSLKARPVGRGNLFRYAGVLFAIFVGMVFFVFGWSRRKALAILASTLWMGLVYAYVIFM